MDSELASDDGIARSAMAKAMRRILPFILLAYIIAYMDRVNVSFASLEMNVDLNFSATVYGLGGGLFFLGYALFEIPSSLMAVRFGARPWLARIMITWGLLAAGMMLVRTPMQFYVMRFLLGVAEAGFFPGMVYYFSGWFPTAFRGRAVSRIYIAAPLGTIVMGAISAPLLGMDGLAALRGWQWLFVVQGLPAVAMGVIIMRFLPEAPASASWLTAPESAWIDRALARDAALIGEPARHNILAAFANPMVLLLGATGFLANGSTVGLSLSAPAVLAAYAGLDTARIGDVVALGGVLAVISILVVGGCSDARGDRFGYAAAGAVILSISLLVTGIAATPALVILGYLGVASTVFTIAFLMVSAWADVLHPRQLAVGAAAINTIWQIGSFASPFAWGIAKDATGSYRLGLIAGAFIAAALAALLVYVRRRVLAERQSRAMAITI